MVVRGEYPVQLGIAYLFLVGYLVRTVFVCFRLPASVGVIFSGFAFSYFFQADIFFGRDLLQQLAFFLVLLTAGLEITLKDLRPYIFIMAIMPAVIEIVAITCYAMHMKEWSLIESLVLANVLVSIGDGLVIPKMKEFSIYFKGHPMPRLVFTWAPLEASFVLTLFGILSGLASPAGQTSVNVPALVFGNVLRICATLGAAAVLGIASGWLIPRRARWKINGQQVFTGGSVEAFLMVLAVALVAYGIGAGKRGHELVPMGFSPGSMFQPELLVIVTGTFFGAVANHEVLREVENILGGVWVFGQLILFSMLGSRTTLGILPQLPRVLPVVAVGLFFRGIGIMLAIFLTLDSRGCGCGACRRGRRACVLQDGLFCFLSTMPRATIQGALGGVPLAEGFFQHIKNGHLAQEFIFTAARLYIICTSVVGMILLNCIGPRILRATSNRPTCEYVSVSGEEDVARASHARSPAIRRTTAIDILAQKYGVDPDDIVDMLEKMDQQRLTEQSPLFHRTSSAPEQLMTKTFTTKAKAKRDKPRASWGDDGVALCQFDATGALLNIASEDQDAENFALQEEEAPHQVRSRVFENSEASPAARRARRRSTGAVMQAFGWARGIFGRTSSKASAGHSAAAEDGDARRPSKTLLLS